MSRIQRAVDALAAGEMVIVVDDDDRENEGDLVVAAAEVTARQVNFMARHGRGLICVSMAPERLRELGVPPMAARNEDPRGTAFHVSVDHVSATTGISAAERARTIRALADPACRPADLVRPGHVFPLGYRPGGVLERDGHTEASIDLCRLAGAGDAAVICEIMRDDGEMARGPELAAFAERWGLPLVSVAELVAHRRTHDPAVRRGRELPVAQRPGLRVVEYEALAGGGPHLAIVGGNPEADGATPVRVHRECLDGHVLGIRPCACADELATSFEAVAAGRCGLVVLLRDDGSPHRPEAAAEADRRAAVVRQIAADLGIDVDAARPGTRPLVAVAGSTAEAA